MFVCFNIPGSTSNPDDSIVNFLLNTFKCAGSGSDVYGAVYKWNDKNFTDSLISIIKERNLNCHFVSGGVDCLNEVSSEIFSFFNLLLDSGIYGKDPGGMMNHNKFIIFKKMNFKAMRDIEPSRSCGGQPDGFTAALYLASANLTKYSNDTDDYEKNNDAILISITDEMYNVIKKYYDTIYLQYKLTDPVFAATYYQQNPWQYQYDVDDQYTKIKSERCKIYMYPRESGTDTLVGVLKNIEHYNVSGLSSKCEIHIVIAGWYSTRKELAETLVKIKKNNRGVVKINIISREFDPDAPDEGALMYEPIYDILKEYTDIWFQNKGVNIHSKYMLIDAPYICDGSYQRQKLVFMGSANYSGAAIDDHWEMICKLYPETGAYNKFFDNFYYLRNTKAAIKIPL